MRKTKIFELLNLSLLLSLVIARPALAVDLPNRSLSLSTAGAGAVAAHTFTFDTTTAANIGSIAFQYCDAAAGTCNTPAGLDTSAAALTAQSGSTGFTIDNSVQGRPIITRTPSQAVAGGATLSYTLSGITNPSAVNTTFFVRITTYTGSDGVTGPVDAGTVAGVTVGSLVISGITPETLIFCVGTSGTDCTNITGSAVNFGVFSPLSTSSGASVMSASTNASSGYAITVNGTTLTYGANTIPAMGTQSLNSAGTSTSQVGTSQFGMNLRANTTPSIGSDVSGAGAGTAFSGYAVPNNFRFFSGDTVATASGPSKTNTYTSSYIVNIAGDQAAGSYTATLTYTCTATF